MKSLAHKLKYLLLFSFIMAGLFSCKKEEVVDVHNQGVNPPPTVERIKSLLAANAPELQEFSVEGDKAASIYGKEGTFLYIPANAFVKPDGSPVTGPVNFELKELLSPGAMILADRPTVSNGQRLVSGGELYMNASQGGVNLRMASGKSIGVEVPTQNFDPNMQLFTGTGSGDNFNWVLNANTVIQQCGMDSLSPGPSYCFGIDSLFNWINCDYYNNDPRPLTEVDMVVPSGYTDSNTVMIIHVPVDQSIVRVSNYANNVFSVTGGYRLPVGINVNFLAIHSDSQNNLFYSLQNNTIAQNHVENMSFQQITETQLIQLIQSL
tara:strand:- start:2189 stop:3154 length:966 start_codon:yes stop_codon:yes gene_type:complete